MNDSEEELANSVFRETAGFFSNIVNIFAVQKMASEVMGCEISLCFPKPGVRKHAFHFALHTSNSVSLESLIAFREQLSCLLKYDAITLMKSDAVSDAEFSSLIPVSPENLQKIWRALQKHCIDKQKKSVARVYKTQGLFSSDEDTNKTPHKKLKLKNNVRANTPCLARNTSVT